MADELCHDPHACMDEGERPVGLNARVETGRMADGRTRLTAFSCVGVVICLEQNACLFPGCISSSVIVNLGQNFSRNVLSRYGIVSLEIVLILAPSINLNPRKNLFAFCFLCTDPYLFPACVIMFIVIFVFVCFNGLP